MKRPATLSSGIWRAALLVLLLAAQGAAVAHEFTHWGQPAQELCATCSLTSGLDIPVPSQAPILEHIAETTFLTREDSAVLHIAPARHYLQRAPPFYL